MPYAGWSYVRTFPLREQLEMNMNYYIQVRCLIINLSISLIPVWKIRILTRLTFLKFAWIHPLAKVKKSDSFENLRLWTAKN